MSTKMDQRIIGPEDIDLLKQLTEAETRRINQAVSVESEWWSDYIIHDESKALNDGSLIRLPDEGDNFRLIGDLRGEVEPRSITPQAYSFLKYVVANWAKRIGNDSENVWLAVMSLYRSLEQQKKEALTNPLASRGFSSHTAGKAIDFDPNGYYFGEDRKSIQTGNPNVTFNPIYRDTLVNVLRECETEGLCHIIFEKRYRVEENHIVEYTACIHVCVSPEYV